MTPAEAAIGELINAAMSAERELGCNAGMDEGHSVWQALKAAERHVLSELDALRRLCACAYQLAGVVDAPLSWLNALNDAANGENFSDEDLLPIGLEHLDAFYELRARCEAGDALLIEASNRLEELGKGGHICDAIDAHLKGANHG